MIAAPAKVREVKENFRRQCKYAGAFRTKSCFPSGYNNCKELRKKNFILLWHVALISKHTVSDPRGKVKKIYD